MEKNIPHESNEFDLWNIQKQHIHNEKPSKFFHEREMWWCSLGVNVGFEENGKGEDHIRPVLILKAFSLKTCLIIPATSSSKTHKFRIPICVIKGIQASGIISQLRVVDSKRLIEKISLVEKVDFDRIRKAVKDLL